MEKTYQSCRKKQRAAISLFPYAHLHGKNNTVYNISVVAIDCIGNSSASSVTGKTCESNCMHLHRMYCMCINVRDSIEEAYIAIWRSN